MLALVLFIVTVGTVLSIFTEVELSALIFPALSIALKYIVSFLSAAHEVWLLLLLSKSLQALLVPLYFIWYFAIPDIASVDVTFVVTLWFVQFPPLLFVIVGAAGAVLSIFIAVELTALTFPALSIAL